MINVIRIDVKFDDQPSTNFLDSYSDELISMVDDYCNYRERSYITEAPSPEMIEKKAFIYTWEIEVADCRAYPKEIFDIVTSIAGGKVLLVDVRDKKYDPRYNNCNVGYKWTNEGSVWFRDSKECYVDPYYDFHINGSITYTIIHIPSYALRHKYSFKGEEFEKSGKTFMWRCTASYDNFMKATTLEEAIKEFEALYRKKLWETVEARKKSLTEAVDTFAAFDEYLWNKEW